MLVIPPFDGRTDHGHDGLRGKFAVYKQADRDTTLRTHDVFVRSDRIGEAGEFVFVLRPHSDEAAWKALLYYADVVQARAPQLAIDIEERLQAIYEAQYARAAVEAECCGHPSKGSAGSCAGCPEVRP